MITSRISGSLHVYWQRQNSFDTFKDSFFSVLKHHRLVFSVPKLWNTAGGKLLDILSPINEYVSGITKCSRFFPS